ncbi:MAG: peptidyl-prolyl cis-trans isomerase [Chitinophagales bacterium]
MTKILKDPLLHFLFLGGLLFLLYGFLNQNEEQPEDFHIVIEESDVNRLAKSYEQNWNAPPDSLTLQNLIEAEIKAEIFYREALRMNLDHNDEIIRRRLKQKYEFLVKDLTTPQRASEEILQRFYQAHPDLYQSPPKISFHQFYFNPDSRKHPLEDAQKALENVANEPFEGLDKNQIGDNFHLQKYYAARDVDHVRQLFGQDFANALFEAVGEGWREPIVSGYGTHLVYVEKLDKQEALPFEEVKGRVLEDWKAGQQAEYSKELFENLREKYKVEIK